MNIFGLVDEYISRLFPANDAALIKAEQAIEASKIPQISVTHNQGKFLHVLARLCNSKKILEIGTLGGYSTIWMAKALPKDGLLISLELDAKHAAIAKENIVNAGLNTMVDIRIGKALDLLPQIHKKGEGPFDMIFIDADKPPYAEYLEWALELSHPGTLIVADNVIREGKVMDENTTDPMVAGAQRFNKILSSTKGVTATILQTVGAKDHDGMALIVVN